MKARKILLETLGERMYRFLARKVYETKCDFGVMRGFVDLSSRIFPSC